MATMDQMVEDYKNSVASAIHMMIIGPSKAGKSDYVAQAALAGFELVYIDNDNGFPTLYEQLGDKPDVMARVHYFRPADFTEVMISLLENPVMRYNERTRTIYQPHLAKPDDMITLIYPTRIPKHVLFSFDSLSTLSLEALKDAAKKQGVNLTQIDKYSREIYTPAGFQVSQICQMLQHAPFSFIMQAHPVVYEIKEKPEGFTNAREIKEADMIIKETWDIPQGTSNPNGHSLGKFFNQIGWLELDRFDKFKIDFRPKRNRVVGGTPNSIGDPRGSHSYRKLFGKGIELPGPPPNPERPWIERITAAELMDRIKKPAAGAKPATAPAKPAQVAPATGAIPELNPKPATPTGVKLGGLKLGK